MTILKVKCKKCGIEGEYNSEIFDGLCQKCGENSFCKVCDNKILQKDILTADGNLCLECLDKSIP